jgi:hypothetical protein
VGQEVDEVGRDERSGSYVMKDGGQAGENERDADHKSFLPRQRGQGNRYLCHVVTD